MKLLKWYSGGTAFKKVYEHQAKIDEKKTERNFVWKINFHESELYNYARIDTNCIHNSYLCSMFRFVFFFILLLDCALCSVLYANSHNTLTLFKKKWWWWWHVRLYFSISKCPRFTSSTPFWIRLNWIPYKILQEIAFIPVHDIRICCHWRFSAHFRFICRRIPLIVIST